jgi:hypothetical protein
VAYSFIQREHSLDTSILSKQQMDTSSVKTRMRPASIAPALPPADLFWSAPLLAPAAVLEERRSSYSSPKPATTTGYEELSCSAVAVVKFLGPAPISEQISLVSRAASVVAGGAGAVKSRCT